MFNVITDLNWLGILPAFLAYFVVGALWFTVFFAKPYKVSLGKENQDKQPTALIFILGPAVCTLVITIASAILMDILKINSFENTFLFSMLVGFGYLVANTVNIAINPNIPRPILYGIISGAYHLVGIFIACTILFWIK